MTQKKFHLATLWLKCCPSRVIILTPPAAPRRSITKFTSLFPPRFEKSVNSNFTGPGWFTERFSPRWDGQRKRMFAYAPFLDLNIRSRSTIRDSSQCNKVTNLFKSSPVFLANYKDDRRGSLGLIFEMEKLRRKSRSESVSFSEKPKTDKQNSSRPKESIKNECRRIIKRHRATWASTKGGTFVSETARRKFEERSSSRQGNKFKLRTFVTRDTCEQTDARLRPRQIKTCRSAKLSSRRVFRVARYFIAMSQQLCNLLETNTNRDAFRSFSFFSFFFLLCEGTHRTRRFERNFLFTRFQSDRKRE